MSQRTDKAEARVLAGRLAASHLTPQQRIERSSRAGNTTLQRFGLEYYSALGRLSAQQRKKGLLIHA